jgi:arylsulfatase A-like enzyme
MSIETGVTYNNIGIDQNVPNMGEWFEQNSKYNRIYCGKWHAGGKWNSPEVSGNRKIPGFDTLPAGSWGGGDFLDCQVSENVEAYIRNHKESNPFLIVAGLLNPHDICYWNNALRGNIVTPSSDIFSLGESRPPLPPNHKYEFDEPEMIKKAAHDSTFSEEQWRNYTYDYYRMVGKLDSDVGRMLDAVESRDNDTIVIFTSDHGEGLGRHCRNQKWHPYDHSLKVPLIISWPGKIKEGIVDTEHLASGVDIMSTVCDFAGIQQPPFARETSLRALLECNSVVVDDWRDHIFAEFKNTGRIIRTNRFKYVKCYIFSGENDKPFVKKIDGSPATFIPGHGYEYQVEPIQMLFDINNDPWELKILIDDPEYTDVIKKHEKLLEDWEKHLLPGKHFDRN